MATGSAALCTAYTDPHGSLHQINVLITFISSSAGWIYPIDRFFGRALYGKCMDICKHGPAYRNVYDLLYFLCSEYYYDIDFTDCTGQEEIQKRHKLLYESYCHLVSIIIIS